jgi:phosphomannomutase/phosphoglucomutase
LETGHSYIKRFNFENKTLVGFEKSGHFFFNTPLGRGYDDGPRRGACRLRYA